MKKTIKILSFCFLLTFISCKKEHNTFIHQAIAVRKNTHYEDLMKFDTIISIEENGMVYTSKLSNDRFSIDRKFFLPNPDSSIGTTIEHEHLNESIVSKILDKRTIKIGRKSYEIIKYNYDRILTQDEESNKYFTIKYGIILETFWKRNFIYSTKVNMMKDSNDLNTLIDSLIKDEDYLFSQFESR